MRRLYLALAVLSIGTAAFAQGSVQNRQLFSDALGESKWVQVYTPEGYDPLSSEQYPLICFLHGAGGNYTSYAFLFDILDSLIGTELIDPVVVVKPDGGGCFYAGWNGCGWVNSETQGDFEDYIVQDVVAWMEDQYNVAPNRRMRSIMGHSMGAFGAMHAALNNPDVYAAVAAHSGYLYFGGFETMHLPIVLSEQSGSPPWTWDPSNGFLTAGWFMLSGGFSPNPANPPFLVDFPLDSFGNIIPSVWDRWLEHDPAALADVLVPGTEPEIYFDCGTADEFLFHDFNVSFDAHLTALGIDHRWRSYAGNHSNRIGLRIPKALRFINDRRDNPTSADDLSSVESSWLCRARPNPVAESTTIDLRLPASGWASLELFDVQGRLRATLVDGELSEGRHRVDWSPSGIPSGVYFYRLKAGDQEETRRLVVSR